MFGLQIINNLTATIIRRAPTAISSALITPRIGDYVWVWDTNRVYGEGWRCGLVTNVATVNPYKWSGDQRDLPDDVMYVEYTHEGGKTSAAWFGFNGWDAGAECPSDFPMDYPMFAGAGVAL